MHHIYKHISELADPKPAHVSALVPRLFVVCEGVGRLPLFPDVAHENVSAHRANLSLAIRVRVQDLVFDTDEIPATRLQVDAICNGGFKKVTEQLTVLQFNCSNAMEPFLLVV